VERVSDADLTTWIKQRAEHLELMGAASPRMVAELSAWMELAERRFQRCATCGLWDWPTSGQCKTCARTEDLQEPDDYCSHWVAEERAK